MKQRIFGWQRVVSQLVFILYLCALFYLLFFSERYGRTDASEEYHYNLVLFREIRRFYEYREILGIQSVLVNLVGNVVAFMPFGFFVPILWPKSRNLFTVALGSFCFSLFVETIQLVSKVGTFDVDDLFLNTLGGVFGYFLMRLLLVWHRRRAHKS